MALERLRLDGKVALVTGGGKGVGRGIASVLAEAGAAVAVTARSADEIEASAQAIRSSGARAIGIAADVTSPSDNARVITQTMDAFGRLDILINNVGGSRSPPFAQLDAEGLGQDVLLNAGSALALSQLAAPHMANAGEGSIVNISSRAATFVSKGRLAYGVAKAALEQLTRLLAQELAPTVRVNAISLGTIMTAALERSFGAPEDRDRLLSTIPLQRIGDVEDIGLAALYFCSRNCYATGAVLHIDGGLPSSVKNLKTNDLR